MGRKHRMISDPDAAHAHEAGSTMTPIRPLEHARLGTVAYAMWSLWDYHQATAARAFDEFSELHRRLVTFPVTSGIRQIADHAFLVQLYRRGCEVVVNAMLAIQHLCNEIEANTGQPPSGAAVLQRLSDAASTAGIDLDKDGVGYAGLLDIRRIRDAIEHPVPENTYGSKWDEVPLAWMLSERSVEAYERWDEWFTALATAWVTAANSAAAVQTVNLERGITSTRPFKKPPPDGTGLSY